MSQATPADIAARLLALSEEMLSVATLMDYYSGFGEWARHGRELAGAAAIAAQWSEHIMKQNEHHDHH